MMRQACVAAVVVVVVVATPMVHASNSDCSYETCSECIAAASCIWCKDPKVTEEETATGETLPQCISKSSPKIEQFRRVCGEAIIDPPTFFNVTKDENLSEGSAIEGSNVQLKPQAVQLKMRTGESRRIKVRYRQLANYPLDLFYLMDGSKSMQDDKEKLASLTSDLVTSLENVTNNFQLGFGMFVDKPMLPYIDTSPWNPIFCKDCIEPFGFKNLLPLTSDRKKFEETIERAQTSTNVDTPEGALDALMQVMVCKREVGWRGQLQLVVVATDYAFHMAGDGRLAGITKPNDMQCHLDASGEYTQSMWQDYPSVGELRHALEMSQAFTTFYVPESQVPLYRLLVDELPRSKYGTMEAGSKNIIKILAEQVTDIISNVKLTTSVPFEVRELISVSVSSKCQDQEEQATDTCHDMLPGDEAEFLIDIEINKCPDEYGLDLPLVFKLDGYQQEFTVNLAMLCHCECDLPGDPDFFPGADQCSSNGDYRCGMCSCYEGFLGKECQCKGVQAIDEASCIQPTVSKPMVCNGLGECYCGECTCYQRPNNERVWGKYCQCTNYKNCRGSNGAICSGNGICDCNLCKCDPGWRGYHCECKEGMENCLAPDAGDLLCSGRGQCRCNKCICEEGYQGKHCEDCQNCQWNCEVHQPCVQCQAFETGSLSASACQETCALYNITVIAELTEDKGQFCSGTDENGCRFLFRFQDKGKDEVLVWVQEGLDCPSKVNIWYVVGGVLGAVVLVGLILLIAWKAYTTTMDRREYAKFIINMDQQTWRTEMSPLYKPATTVTQNPLFQSSTE